MQVRDALTLQPFRARRHRRWEVGGVVDNHGLCLEPGA